jgi:hypothetical protein
MVASVAECAERPLPSWMYEGKTCRAGRASAGGKGKKRKGKKTHILRSVGEEVETGHEADGENAELPVELESTSDLAHELLGLLAGRHGASTRLFSGATVDEELRLGEAEADEGGEEGGGGTEPEEDACVEGLAENGGRSEKKDERQSEWSATAVRLTTQERR